MKGRYFMLEDRNWIKTVVDMRDADAIVIPLYIQIYGKKYSILDMNSIKKRFAPSAFKIGYGTADSMFMKNSFPVNRINEFDLIDTFYEYDSENDINVRYTVFESGDVDDIESNKLNQEIHMYFDLLFNNVKENVDAYFKSLIESENVPIIPKEHVEDNLAKSIPIVEEDDDSLDDNEEDEYPRVTEGSLLGKETVDFINGEGKYSDDDYLSEESVMFNEGFLNYEDDEDDDYSTDFDIF
jgi:hypothetical protein